MIRQILLTFFIGIVLGALGGAVFGWLQPIQNVDADISRLDANYKADYAVMVGQAYARDGDWDQAQARLGRLAEPDPAAYIVSLAEQYIAAGSNPEDIRTLVRMAARFGYTTPAMLPYLPPSN